MTGTNETAEPSGASCGYLVFAEFGPLCWRRPLPLREHETLADAILEARQKAATDTGKFGDVGWVVSTHRDGPCLYRETASPVLPDKADVRIIDYDIGRKPPPDILADYRQWMSMQEDRIGTHSPECHMWPRHERCMIHRLAAEVERLRQVLPQGNMTPP